MAQKFLHTILYWGPRGPQYHKLWNAMQTCVWLFSYWSLSLDNCSHVTRERSTEAFINFSAVWSAAIGIIMSPVCPSVRLPVTLCNLALRVCVQG